MGGGGARAAAFGRRRAQPGQPAPEAVARRGLHNDALQERMQRLGRRISARRSHSLRGDSVWASGASASGRTNSCFAGVQARACLSYDTNARVRPQSASQTQLILRAAVLWSRATVRHTDAAVALGWVWQRVCSPGGGPTRCMDQLERGCVQSAPRRCHR